jgi:hypothetical protein
MKLNLNDYDNIIIYQFGKVGSSTLYRTFSQYNKNTIHTHFFHKNMLKNKTLVLNVTRNLFDRNISAFFQNIYTKPKKEAYITPPDGKHIMEGCFLYTEKREINDLINFFRNVNIKKLLKIRYKHWYSYFNQQLNINIFKDNFDFKKKYSIYNSECNSKKITTIILRFEDINEWATIFDTIFVNKIQILTSNLTSQKNIYQLYKKFSLEYKYTEEEINLIKNIDFMKKFYTDEEINKFIKKYT